METFLDAGERQAACKALVQRDWEMRNAGVTGGIAVNQINALRIGYLSLDRATIEPGSTPLTYRALNQAEAHSVTSFTPNWKQAQQDFAQQVTALGIDPKTIDKRYQVYGLFADGKGAYTVEYLKRLSPEKRPAAFKALMDCDRELRSKGSYLDYSRINAMAMGLTLEEVTKGPYHERGFYPLEINVLSHHSNYEWMSAEKRRSYFIEKYEDEIVEAAYRGNGKRAENPYDTRLAELGITKIDKSFKPQNKWRDVVKYVERFPTSKRQEKYTELMKWVRSRPEPTSDDHFETMYKLGILAHGIPLADVKTLTGGRERAFAIASYLASEPLGKTTEEAYSEAASAAPEKVSALTQAWGMGKWEGLSSLQVQMPEFNEDRLRKI